MLTRKSALFKAIGLLSLFPCISHASSFQILEQSPALMGQGFAGTASTAEDATTVFFNPAALNQLDRSASIGINGIFTESKFRDTNSNTGGIQDKTDEVGVVPNLYAVFPYREGITFGFGVNAPFGLASKYDRNWIGRYLGTFSELEVINISGAVALQLNDQWAVGASVNYQRADVTLESQFDSTLGVSPSPATDSRAKIAGDDDDFTATLALFYTPTEDTKLGLVWHQGGKFDLTGDAKFDLNTACSPGAGYPTGAPPAPTTGTICNGLLNSLAGDVYAKVQLPDVMTFSASQRVNDYWWLHLDVAWTEWSKIKQINIIHDDTNADVSTLDLQYQNSMRYAVGASYEANDQWTWRLGVAYDESPQEDPQHITPRVPDDNRTWLTLGVNYAFSPSLSVDVSYAYLNVDEPKIQHFDPATGHNVEGTFKSKVSILGVQANWRF